MHKSKVFVNMSERKFAQFFPLLFSGSGKASFVVFICLILLWLLLLHLSSCEYSLFLFSGYVICKLSKVM